MENDKFKQLTVKNEKWFDNMYNKGTVDLNYNNKKNGGSILNYSDYNIFVNKYRNVIGKKYILLNINDLSFNSFYGESFKNSIFFKIIKDIDENINNKAYTYKNSLLYKELKENKITTLSKYFKLEEPNNLEKYSKFYEFLPWNKKFLKYPVPSKICGPYSDSIINMHFIKFKRLLESIKQYGIKYHEKNMIKGFVLKKEKSIKLVTISGTHRTIILKYLFETNELKINTTNIICEKTDEINLSNINEWFHVKNGFISKKNANKIFNHLYTV